MSNRDATRTTIGWSATVMLMIATVIGAGCASNPSAPAVRRQAIPDGHAEGAALYVKHCGDCHDLHDPASYTDFQWSQHMIKMARKANLDGRRAALIEAYVKAAND